MAATNSAAWLRSKGHDLEVGTADMPQPGDGEVVIANQAIPLAPGDYKIQKGLIPIPIKYPTVLGNSVAGLVHDVGPGVIRFKKGDRVLSSTAFIVKNDGRFGAQQKFSLAPAYMTSKIGDVPFEGSAHAGSVYAAMSAWIIHLGLDKPSKTAKPKNETVLVWGGSSSVGMYAIQIASQAGYKVVTTASSRNAEYLKSLGAAALCDYKSSTVYEDLLSHGPYRSIYAASDDSSSQIIMGKLLAVQGGGRFLSTMGPRPEVTFPPGVECFFAQFLDDYVDPKNREFAEWFFWEYMEQGLQSGELKLGKVEVIGGLEKVQEGLNLLHDGKIGSKKLVIRP